MTSRDTTTAALRRTRTALFLTTAVAGLALPSLAYADATVSGANTPGAAQVTINAGSTAAANTTTFDGTAVVSPGGTLQVGNIGGFGTTVVTVDKQRQARHAQRRRHCEWLILSISIHES